jgi:hypothetical protein
VVNAARFDPWQAHVIVVDACDINEHKKKTSVIPILAGDALFSVFIPGLRYLKMILKNREGTS